MLKKGKKVLKKGCVFLFVMLAMCLLSNLAFSGIKEGPRPGEKNPVSPNRASLFCDDELWLLVGYPEEHKTNQWSFAPTNANLTDWSEESSEFQHNNDIYALHDGYPSPWAVASGRIAAYDHDQVVQAFFTLGGETQIELWDFPNRVKWVHLTGSLWSYDSGYVDVAVGDLDLVVDDNGFYHDEIVVARTVGDNYEVQVDVLDHNLSSIVGSVSVPANRTACRLAVATGDFDGDGNLEFAVAQMGESTEYQIDVFRFSRDEHGNPNLEKATTYTENILYGGKYIDMAAGDFNGDRTDEIAVLASGFFHFLDVDQDLNLDLKDTSWPWPKPLALDSKIVSGLFKFDLENGYGITRRQVAACVQYSSSPFIFTAIYETIYLDNDLKPYSMARNSRIMTDYAYTYPMHFGLSAGNFVGHQGENKSPLMDIAISYNKGGVPPHTLQILEILTPALENKYTWISPVYPDFINKRPLAVVAYDKDGDTYRLGPPAHITIENLIGLDYVIQEPPKHVDYLPKNPDDPEDEWNWDVINVSACPEFYVEFKDEQEQTVATKTKDTSSWAIGGSAELDIKTTVTGGLGNIAKVSLSAESDTKISYDYNSSKSSYESDYQTRSVSYASQTNEDDFLHGKFQLIDIWRYPIYGYNTGDENNPHGFQEIILPGPKSPFGCGGRNHADWYQPIHQNRNVLSYPSLEDQNFPSDLGSFKLPDHTKVTDIMNEGAIRCWDGNQQDIHVKWTDTAGSGETKSYNHTLSESEDITIGASAKASYLVGSAEVDTRVKLNFHNSNSWGGSKSEDTKNSESTGIHIHIAEGTGSEQAYAFKSAIYVSSGGGTFKVAHATDPLGSTLGAGWWKSQYGRKPDPALNLPNRFEWHQDDYIGYWTLVEEDTRKRMRGFFLRASEEDPISGEHELLGKILTDGDVVNVCARVYNFSLSQPTGGFDIQWLYVPFDNVTGKEVGERKLIGQKHINLDPMKMQEYYHVWDTTGLSEMSEGNSYRIYVIVDPTKVVDEIHEWKDADGNLLAHGNNEGYWPWSDGIIITSKESMAGMAISDVDISMHDESLAVKMPAEIVSQGPVSLTVGGHYMLRAHFVSNALHPHYRYALFYDGDPDQGGEVIASAVVRGVLEGDNYIWFEWTPKEPGDYELWVVVLEDSDDPESGNSSDMLRVNVSDVSDGGDDDDDFCFIATACYGTSMADEVKVLKRFRDEYLLTNPVGKALVSAYYKTSPPVADFIKKHPVLKKMVRTALKPVVWVSGKVTE